ncbi:PREDICTED: putative F-box/kelch-repeat protein At1g12170 [Camelina sativa]|uniref:F-box/kelch-repeat protein At1g12170 n=1 Tax=Camelina sativa TaxID=90675 RepID=A0ABM1R7A6_CAMSA|nr:PREDICTED: putative F-box/kelch-repeat protein At1g12170 [Camelina sativa]
MMHVQLPWELVEEILYRVPVLSVIRFKIVCKQWYTLFKSKSFINNYSVHVLPQFFIWTDSKMYSVSVNLSSDPKIRMHELPLDIPYFNNAFRTNFLPCDGLLFCDSWSWRNKAAIWNPWLRQTRWIEGKKKDFLFRGIGYDSGKPEKVYNIFGSTSGKIDIYDLENNEWKYTNSSRQLQIRTGTDVSLNGNLYWAVSDQKTDNYLIQSFNFSKEVYKVFCVLPWNKNSYNFPALSTFKKDRLSVLKRIIGANNIIEVWVTKNKINNDDGEHVTWINFTTVSIPISVGFPPSYFIDNVYKKSFVMCCKDENKQLCIYIVRGNALTKIQIDVEAKDYINHCSYVPSLTPIPEKSSDFQELKY